MFEVITVSDVVQSSLLTVWTNVLGFLPQLFAAVIVFILGIFVAVLMGKIVAFAIKSLQLDRALESLGFEKFLQKGGYRLNAPHFFYELVKWFFIVVFLMAATNIIGLTQVTDFLSRIILYLPNVFVAAFVLAIGVLLARFLEGFVRGAAKAAHLSSANFLGLTAQWTVVLFSLLVALDQLGVAPEIIRIIITGAVAGGSIAIGLAFGLGGRSHAEELIGKIKNKVTD